MWYRQPEIRNTLLIGTFFSFVYVLLYVSYLDSVVKMFHFAYGYLRPDLKPGPFINDRYNYEWFFLMINTTRGFFPFFYLFTFIGLTQRGKRIWFGRLGGLLWFFDWILLIYFLIAVCFFCNNATFPWSLCNDPNYCLAYAADHTDRCTPLTADQQPLQQCDLSLNTIFLRWIYYTLVFFFLDWLLLLLNTDMHLAIEKFLRYY